MNRDIRTILILGLLLFLPGCPALLSALATASQGAQWISSAIDVAEAGKEAYFARHPSVDNEPKVAKAIRGARAATAVLNAALAAGDAVADEDMAKAKAEALRTYGELRDLLLDLGVLEGRAPPGGAETEAPLPEPFTLPTADDIGLSWEFKK